MTALPLLYGTISGIRVNPAKIPNTSTSKACIFRPLNASKNSIILQKTARYLLYTKNHIGYSRIEESRWEVKDDI